MNYAPDDCDQAISLIDFGGWVRGRKRRRINPTTSQLWLLVALFGRAPLAYRRESVIGRCDLTIIEVAIRIVGGIVLRACGGRDVG